MVCGAGIAGSLGLKRVVIVDLGLIGWWVSVVCSLVYC